MSGHTKWEEIKKRRTKIIMRAKFRVNSMTLNAYADDCTSFKLSAVNDGSIENKEFFRSTPAGTMDITVHNPAVRDYLKLGKDYYLDFIEAD